MFFFTSVDDRVKVEFVVKFYQSRLETELPDSNMIAFIGTPLP
jgi:hypothetical protein